MYRCQVTFNNGSMQTSDIVYLVSPGTDTTFRIIQQPSNITYQSLGDTVTLTVKTNDPNATYS
jgi:hypothetical protein